VITLRERTMNQPAVVPGHDSRCRCSRSGLLTEKLRRTSDAFRAVLS
jgi:hypothetical protein